MKIRFLVSVLALALATGGLACDKKEESTSSPAPAAKQEEKKAEENAEEKAEEKADVQGEEKAEEKGEEKGEEKAEGLSEEEVQKKLEEAKAQALAEAQAKIEAARAEGKAEGAAEVVAANAPKEHTKEEWVKAYADVECSLAKLEDKSQADVQRLEVLKKYEYALEGYVADMAKYKDASAEAAKDACMPQMSQEEKDAVTNLAVDLGCLRKKETDAQKMLQIEGELYTEAGLDQAGFVTKLAEVKAKDPSVDGKINGAIGECPTFEDVQRSKVVGILVQNKCLRQANVKADRLGQLQKDILENFDMTAADYAALRNKFMVDPGFKDAIEEGTKNCPPVSQDEIVTEEEAKAKPVTGIQGVYSGKVFGSVGGQILVKVLGKKTIDGTAQIGGTVFKIHGYLLPGHKMTAQGSHGNDFVRVYGSFGKSNHTLNGSWTGALTGKKRSGSVYMTRK